MINSHGLVLVQVDPELPDVKSQAQQRAVWALRLAEPEERDFILRTVEADLNSDVNYDAMLAALRLSKPQTAVLLAGYMARPLRTLVREQPPRQEPQAVAIAFWREVADHSRYLSIDDVWSLAMSAATEVARRTPGGMDPANLRGQAIRLYDACIAELQMGNRTRDTDPWLNRSPGPLEAYLLAEFQRQGVGLSEEALPALLMAPARWLQDGLEHAETAEGWAPEKKLELGNCLKNAFEQLLSQSFALGEEAPQALYEAFQHRVCAALDQLGFAYADPVGTPGAQLLQSIGFTVGQHDSDASRLSPEQTAVLRDAFRASPLRRLICDKATSPTFLDVSIDALVLEVLQYCDYLSGQALGTLFQSAAAEIVRRDPSVTESLVVQELTRRVETAGDARFRCWAPERWEDASRGIGRVETQVAVQIQRSMALESHALPLLLIASARCLDELLGMRSDVPGEWHALATAIQNAFERLLAQSFALGANAPQDLYATFVPVVRDALRRLGHGGRPAVNTPTQETLRAIGFILGQPALSKGSGQQQSADPVAFTPGTTSSSRKRSAGEMEEGESAALLMRPVDLSKVPTFSNAVRAAIDARDVHRPLPDRQVQSAVQPQWPVRPAEDVQVQASPTDPQVCASQQILMNALKLHKYNGTQRTMEAVVEHIKEKNLGFKEAIEYLGKELTRDQFTVLITMCRGKATTYVEHLATLYLLYGRNPSPRETELLSMMPSTLPLCFIPYKKAIEANIRRWPGKLRGPFLTKLGLES